MIPASQKSEGHANMPMISKEVSHFVTTFAMALALPPVAMVPQRLEQHAGKCLGERAEIIPEMTNFHGKVPSSNQTWQ